MEDSVRQWVDLITAILTFVTFTVFNTVVAWVGNATFGTGGHMSVGETEHIVQTSSIVLKTFVEMLNGKPHLYSVLQRLHVVKG